MLQEVAPHRLPDGALEMVRTLDLARDPYLDDHRLDGVPVLPAAVALELIAEAASVAAPGHEVVCVEDFRVLGGVVLESGARSLRVLAAPAIPDAAGTGLRVEVGIAEPGSRRHCYRAHVRMGRERAAPHAPGLPPLAGATAFPMSVRDAYEKWLFHGPRFQGITAVAGISENGLSATLSPSSPRDCLRGASAASWLIDPVVIDSAFQLAILWSRMNTGMTPLPSRFRRYHRFAPLTAPALHCELRAESAEGGHLLTTHVELSDGHGRLLGRLEGMEFSCSESLNRLAGHPAPEPAR